MSLVANSHLKHLALACICNLCYTSSSRPALGSVGTVETIIKELLNDQQNNTGKWWYAVAVCMYNFTVRCYQHLGDRFKWKLCLLTVWVFRARHGHLNWYQVSKQRSACGMLGHLLVYCRDQHMVHRMIKVNLNITVFISALFVGVFKKSQTVHIPSGCENYETSLIFVDPSIIV